MNTDVEACLKVMLFCCTDLLTTVCQTSQKYLKNVCINAIYVRIGTKHAAALIHLISLSVLFQVSDTVFLQHIITCLRQPYCFEMMVPPAAGPKRPPRQTIERSDRATVTLSSLAAGCADSAVSGLGGVSVCLQVFSDGCTVSRQRSAGVVNLLWSFETKSDTTECRLCASFRPKLF